MKKALILRSRGAKSPDQNLDWSGLKDGISPHLVDAEVSMAALTDLVFEQTSERASITHCEESWDIADFDLVIFRLVGRDIELAIAAAHYLDSKSVQFIDQYLLTEGKGKLAGAFLRQKRGLPVPQTYSSSNEVMIERFTASPPLQVPFILKADVGSKGRDNYLVKSFDQLKTILSSADSDMRFIAQNFIENDGDYRILVFSNEPVLVIHRKGKQDSHLNNTSQGGIAKLLEIDSLGKKVLDDAIKATRLERLQVSGVDIIVDKHTNQHYILEVNRAPQLATGEFTDQKIRAYAEMINKLLSDKN